MRITAICCALIAFPAFAQFQAVVSSSRTPGTFPTPGEPLFELHSDIPSPEPGIIAGYSNVPRKTAKPASVNHRYFYDEPAGIYFGYDLVIQPEDEVDRYRVDFYDLSIGPLDLQTDTIDPALWKRLPLAALPEGRVVEAGDAIAVEVYRNPNTGGKLIDTFRIAPAAAWIRPYMHSGPQVWQQMHDLFARPATAVPARGATLSGDAREFSADDAELRIQPGRVTINGAAQQRFDNSRTVGGPLVWFYAPGHGRYILSLTPRAGLGFVKAGEVRGGLVMFTADGDEVVLQSPAMVAPGDEPYVVFVLHDAAWVPAAERQTGLLLFGSVSPRELAALQEK